MAATAKVKIRNATATVQAIKPDLGYLCALQVINGSAAAAYVQLFDAPTTGAVTLGTTTPDLEVLVPQASQVIVPLPSDGVEFLNGIMVASTTTEMGATGSAAGVQVFAQIT